MKIFITHLRKENYSMKKTFAIILTLIILLTTSLTTMASSTPAKTYEPGPVEDIGAWSYIKITPVSGEVSKTHYVFSNYQTTSYPIEGIVDKVSGLTYSKKSNTLTVKNYKHEDVVLTAHNMGTGFTVKLAGKNTLRSIKVINKNWDSGLTITGNGSVTLGNKGDHERVPLDVTGNLTLMGGTVICIAEETDIQSASGTRYTVLAKSNDAYPLATALKYKGDVSGNRMDSDETLVSSKDNVTFKGKAIGTKVSPKRTGKTVSWSKKSGYKYQTKIGSTIKTTSKTSVKSAKKVQVRLIKIKDGVMKIGAWSKKV